MEDQHGHHHVVPVVNWEELLGPAVHQGSTHFCWAIAACRCIEGMHMKEHGSNIKLSDQNLITSIKSVDLPSEEKCIKKEGYWSFTYDLRKVFDHIVKYGVEYDSMEKRLLKVDDYSMIKPYDEKRLRELVRRGPVAVDLMMTKTSFRLFQDLINFEGVFKASAKPDEEIVKHAVVLIGYGFDPNEGVKYWIISNSRGPEWGQGGVGRICEASCLPPGHMLEIICGYSPVLPPKSKCCKQKREKRRR